MVGAIPGSIFDICFHVDCDSEDRRSQIPWIDARLKNRAGIAGLPRRRRSNQTTLAPRVPSKCGRRGATADIIDDEVRIGLQTFADLFSKIRFVGEKDKMGTGLE